jgi:hypothetical protein
MFADGVAGRLNPEFEAMFRMLFKATVDYLDTMGWMETGGWVQVIDEPSWSQNETLQNTLAIIKLYKSVDPRIKIFQTSWPQGEGDEDHPNQGQEALSLDTRSATQPWASGGDVPPYALPLLDEVDWWCPHVCQWTSPGVPEAMAALRAKRSRDGHAPVRFTVYDNGTPIIESPWERLRTQALDVWISNGTLDGTLSWYSVNSYPTSDSKAYGPPATQFKVADPWLHPYPTPLVWRNGTEYLRYPAGWGYLLWPLPPQLRKGGVSWTPVESVRWVMTGSGIQDSEYLFALQKQSPRTKNGTALLAQARTLATHFPKDWNPTCFGAGTVADWGNDGFAVDPGRELDGSSVFNTWRLAMGVELDAARQVIREVE